MWRPPVLGALLCLACSSAHTSAAPVEQGPLACEVGSGFFSFVTIQDGDSVPIILGPQGGYHIWGSVLARGVVPQGVTLRYTLSWPGGADINSVETIVDLDPSSEDAGLYTGPGWGESLGCRVFVPDPTVIQDKTISMSVEVTDVDGRDCSAAHLIVPHQ